MTKHLPEYPSLPHSDNPFIFDGSLKVTSKVQLIGLWKLIKNRAKIHLQEKLTKRDFLKVSMKNSSQNSLMLIYSIFGLTYLFKITYLKENNEKS